MRELAMQLVQAQSKGGEGTSVEGEDDGVEGVGVGVGEQVHRHADNAATSPTSILQSAWQ